MAIVEITKPARFDRLEILSDLATKAGVKVADRYAYDFRACFMFLQHTPEGGAPRPRLKQKARIYTVHPYVIIYEYNEDNDLIRILRIVHGKRRISARLLKGSDNWDA